MLPNNVSGKDGQFDVLTHQGSYNNYTYQMKNKQKSEITLERLPMRSVNINCAKHYKGYTG